MPKYGAPHTYTTLLLHSEKQDGHFPDLSAEGMTLLLLLVLRMNFKPLPLLATRIHP